MNFFKPVDQNDLEVVQKLIYPIFSKNTEKDKQYWTEIRSLFLTAMKNAKLHFLIRHIFWLYVNRTITEGLKQKMPLMEVEATLRKFLRKRADNKKDQGNFELESAKRSYGKIKNYIVGEKILDLGAGNGLLALEIKKQLAKDVVLVDVLDYNLTDLPLFLYDQEGNVPLEDREVDTTVLYTVLHHASDPEHLLKEATRVTKRRLIIMEAYVEEDYILMTNSFFDWFYNRVVGDEDINVPLNFLNIEGWGNMLKSSGFDIIKSIDLGICEPLVPEHQVLIISEHSNE